MGILSINAETKPLQTDKPITKEDVLQHYSGNFSKIGCLQPPVSFTIKSEVAPIQMPIHRSPSANVKKEKATIDQYVAAGILAPSFYVENSPTSFVCA